MTALHCAAEEGYCTVVEYLLKEGAYIDAQNSFGETALHLAIKRSYVNMAETLVKHVKTLT